MAFTGSNLDVSVSQQIQIHLSDCSPCMQRAEFRRHIKVVVRSKCAGDDVPPALEHRIRALLDEPPAAS